MELSENKENSRRTIKGKLPNGGFLFVLISKIVDNFLI